MQSVIKWELHFPSAPAHPLSPMLTSLESRAKVVNARRSEGEPSDKVCESVDAAAHLKSDEHFASIWFPHVKKL